MTNVNRGVPQRIVILIGLEAATFAVMSLLHLTGALAGGRRPFRPSDAGIAEAVICVALICGAAAFARYPLHGRAIALGTLGFATLGVIAGLSFTVRGGGAIDIAYHAAMLPLLLTTLAATSARLSVGPHPPAATSRT